MEKEAEKELHNDYEISFASLHPIVQSFEVGSRVDVDLHGTDDVKYTAALLELFRRFIPSSLAFIIEMGILASNILYISTLNDSIMLSGGGLGFATVNLTVFSVNVGLCGGIETLVSQAFGRKDYYLGGVYLNTGRVLLIMMAVIQTLILLNGEQIFLFLNQPSESAAIAQVYILSVLPGVFLNSQFECVRRFLLMQGIYYPALYIISASLGLHIISLYIYIICLEWAITGIAIATATTYSLNFILIMIYGLPAGAMCLAEWWAFEGIILLTGLLGINELSATVVMYNYGLILFMVSNGLSHASTSLIGNNLGANKPKTAKIYTYSVIIFGWSAIVILVLFTILFKDDIFWIYTSDEAVTEQIMYAFPVWIAKLLGDMTQSMVSGSMRATGNQTIAAVAGIISYWIIMLPGAYIFAFTFEFRLRGIWLGIVLGSFVQAACYLYVIFNISWEKTAKEASRHVPISKIMQEELIELEK